MLQLHKCIKCGKEFATGGFIMQLFPKCQYCGSRLTFRKLRFKMTSKFKTMTPQEINTLKQRTGWCDEIVNCIGSMAEANIYIRAGLQARKIGGRWALCRTNINWADYSIRRNTWLKTSTQKRLKDYDRWAEYNNIWLNLLQLSTSILPE